MTWCAEAGGDRHRTQTDGGIPMTAQHTTTGTEEALDDPFADAPGEEKARAFAEKADGFLARRA